MLPENAYNMRPRSAVRSKCELLSVFEGSGVPGANEDLRFGVGGASTGRSGEPVGCPKPCQIDRRSYKNRCWRCLCQSFAENAYEMRPGSAVSSKYESLCGVYRGWGRAKNLDKCVVGPTKIDVGGVCVSRLSKMFTRWNVEAP